MQVSVPDNQEGAQDAHTGLAHERAGAWASSALLLQARQHNHLVPEDQECAPSFPLISLHTGEIVSIPKEFRRVNHFCIFWMSRLSRITSEMHIMSSSHQEIFFYILGYYAFWFLGQSYCKCFILNRGHKKNLSLWWPSKIFTEYSRIFILGGSDRIDRPLHGDRGLHLPVFGGRQSDGGGRGGLPG